MNKLLTFILLSLTALGTNAGTLDELKNIPASKYEIGKMQLEFGAYLLTQKHKDKNVGKSSFEIEGFRVAEEADKLFFFTTLVGRANKMNDQVCKQLKSHLVESGPLTDLGRKTWSGLTDAQYQALEKEFIVAVELISKENKSFRIQC